MEEQNALEKKKRCPNGFVRNKEGICVPKEAKVPKAKVTASDNIVATVDTQKTKEKTKEKPKEKPKEKSKEKPKEKADKSKKALPKKAKAKTMKKMTKIQAVNLLTERRECVQMFRNKL